MSVHGLDLLWHISYCAAGLSLRAYSLFATATVQAYMFESIDFFFSPFHSCPCESNCCSTLLKVDKRWNLAWKVCSITACEGKIKRCERHRGSPHERPPLFLAYRSRIEGWPLTVSVCGRQWEACGLLHGKLYCMLERRGALSVVLKAEICTKSGWFPHVLSWDMMMKWRRQWGGMM